MSKHMTSVFFCLMVALSIPFKTTEAFSVHASISLLYFNNTSNRSVSEHCVCGLYGLHSPRTSVKGLVGIPKSANLQACDEDTQFTVTEAPWIALIEKGNCKVAEKINIAARRGAAAAVIYGALDKGAALMLGLECASSFEPWMNEERIILALYGCKIGASCISREQGGLLPRHSLGGMEHYLDVLGDGGVTNAMVRLDLRNKVLT